MINAFIYSYVPGGSTIDVLAFFADTSSLNTGSQQASLMGISYSNTSGDVSSQVEAAVNAYCDLEAIPRPDVFTWLTSTPDRVAAQIAAAIPPAPSSYQTIVTQSGTSAPAVSGSFAPTNTYAGSPTFTWARTGAGVYTLTASAAVFNTSGKTGVFVGSLNNLNGSYKTAVTSSTVITITTAVQSLAVLGLLGFTATNTDGLLSQMMVYVQTYS